MKAKLRMMIIWLVIASFFTVFSCSETSEIESAVDAREAALGYLQEQYDEHAPATNLDWQEEDVTPPQWVGGVFKEYRANQWIVKITYPVVSLESTIYQLVIFNNDHGWHWKGTVEFDGTITELSNFRQITEEISQQIALDFLKNSPTFAFDGIEGSINLIRVEPAFCPYCWGFVYQFQCSHAGYGDRHDKMLAQVITDHEAIISISMGEVDGGTIDDYWDIITQQEISTEPPGSQDEITLENTKWSLQSYGQPGHLSDILADTEITLELDSAEGTVRGLAGCNSYFGSYQLQGNHLSIPGPIAVTEMYCMEPTGIMDQEQEYLSILQLTAGYDIEGDQLQINCGNQILIYISAD